MLNTENKRDKEEPEKGAVAGLWRALKTTLRILGITKGSKVVKEKLSDLPFLFFFFKGERACFFLFLFYFLRGVLRDQWQVAVIFQKKKKKKKD